ncbi:MAG: hypothetical protein HYY17_04375 [Planctomycetes bacterium]|nr:hypothetical protein [Planctomycetota bacterium]
MKIFVRVLPLLTLLSCGTFEGYWTDGQKGAVQVQLRTDEWLTSYGGRTVIAAGGSFNLFCREKESRKLWARSRDPKIVLVPEDDQKSGREPVADTGGRWRVSYALSAPGPGKVILDFGEGDTVVDSVELDVKKVDRFLWKVATEKLRSRQKGGGLELFVGDAIEIRIEYIDERSWALVGIGAFDYEFLDAGTDATGTTSGCCAFKFVSTEGPSNTIRLEATQQGSTTLTLRARGGSSAKLAIPVLVR